MSDEANISTKIGDTLIEKHNVKTLHDRIFLYRGGYYQIDDNFHIIRKDIRNILDGEYTTHYVRETINYIKDTTRLIDFEPLPYVSLRNKIINTEDMTLYDPTPKLFVTNKINVEFDASISTDDWKEFIKQIIPDEEHRLTLQEFIGYSFVQDQRCKKALFIVGPKNSGKSTLFNILIDFFGEDNCSHLQLSELLQRFSNYGLYNKMVNVRADIDYRIPLLSVNLIKSLTGDDLITLEQKYHDPIAYRNKAKIILSANDTPQIPSAADDAFFDRWLVLECPNTFRIKNPVFYNKFTTHEAKSAILTWAFEGLVRLRKNNWQFTYSPASEEIRQWFKSGEIKTTVEKFLSEKCFSCSGEYELKEDLYNAYRKWCSENGIPPMHQNVFHGQIKSNQLIPVSQYRPRDEDGIQQYAWKGLWLIDVHHTQNDLSYQRQV